MPRGSINDLHYQSFFGESFRSILDTNGNPIYIGTALPGTLNNTSAWKIRKITYDSTYSSSVVSIQWAEGTDNADKIWSSPATDYTYY